MTRVPGTGTTLRAKLEHFVHIYGLCGGDWSRLELQKAEESVKQRAWEDVQDEWEKKVDEVTRMGLLPDK